ncbi:MAG: cytochrome c3 family protein [Desulfobulbaceae bacterium]|nr:cytochrome c3 family protein [Desulfobulbaceae bacterium]
MLNQKLIAAALALLIAGAGTLNLAQAAEPLPAPVGKITITGKKPVSFDHQIHLKLGVACGQCHHDAKHQPRSAEAIGALAKAGELQCATCHNDKFAKAELRQRKDIFHARCKECHQTGVNGKQGPTNCAGCHGANKKAVEGC